MLPETEPCIITEVDRANVILVVEEDAATAELLVAVLSQELPSRVYVAKDGVEALQVVSQIKPQLFLLDCHPPGGEGLQLYDHLHARTEFKEIPALILSTCLTQYHEEIASRKLCALAKPFEIDDLLALIEEVLGSPSESSSQ